MKTPAWSVPATRADAETRLFALWDEMEEIKLQLSDPAKTDRAGQPLSPADYRTWHQRAKHSLSMKTREYRFLQRWIRHTLGLVPPSEPPQEYRRLVEIARRIVSLTQQTVDQQEVTLPGYLVEAVTQLERCLPRESHAIRQ